MKPILLATFPFLFAFACGDSRNYKDSEPAGQGGGSGAGGKGGAGAAAGGKGGAGAAGRGGASAGEGGAAGQDAESGGAGGESGDVGGGTGGDPAAGAAGEGGGAEATAGVAGDAGAAGAAGSDPGPAPRCDPSKAFQAPTYVASLSSQEHFDASLTADGLTMIVWQGAELATAKRSSPDGSFGAPVPDPLMADAAAFFNQSQAHELPKISGDALALYSAFGGQGNTHIYWAERLATTEAFGTPVKHPDFEDALRGAPFPSFDGKALYLRQTNHLYVATKTQAGFGPPAPLSVLDSPEGEYGPVPRHDQLVLYFNSSRSDGTAKGRGDVWRARRADVDDDFDPPRAVDELNTEGDEKPVWVSADDCEIFLVRWIEDNTGSTTPRVMSARRPL